MADENLIIGIKVEGGKESVKLLQSVGQVVKQIDKDSEKLASKLNKAMSSLSQEIRVLSAATELNTKYALAQEKIAQSSMKTATAQEKLAQAYIKTSTLKTTSAAKELIAEQQVYQAANKTAIAMENKERAVWNNIKAEVQAESASLRLSNQIKKMGNDADNSANIFKKLGLSIQVALGNFVSNLLLEAQRGIEEFARSIVKAGVELDALNNTMMAATGGWKQGQNEMNWLIGMSNRLGVSFGDVSDSYGKFMTSFTRSGGTISQSRQIFEDLSTAMVSLHLPAERMQGVFVALEQMANKGTVQSEELKRQLGNALPGAFELAAESMGILPAKLMDLMQKGQVFSKDFLPNFAATVKNALGQSIDIASQQFNAAMNRLASATELLKMNLGQMLNDGLLPIVNGAVKVTQSLANMAKYLNENRDVVVAFTSALAELGVVIIGLKWQAVTTAVIGLASVIRTGLIASLKALQAELATINVELAGLPILIGTIVVGVSALATSLNNASKEAADISSYIGLSGQIVNLTKDFETLDNTTEEGRESIAKYQEQFPSLMTYLAQTGKSFRELTNEEINHIAVLGKHDMAMRAVNDQTKEMASWQAKLTAGCQVWWGLIKDAAKTMADAVVGAFKYMSEAIATFIRWFSETMTKFSNKVVSFGEGVAEVGSKIPVLGKQIQVAGVAIESFGHKLDVSGTIQNVKNGLSDINAKFKESASVAKGVADDVNPFANFMKLVDDKVAINAMDNLTRKLEVINKGAKDTTKSLIQAQTAAIGLEKGGDGNKKGKTAKTKTQKQVSPYEQLTKDISAKEKELESAFYTKESQEKVSKLKEELLALKEAQKAVKDEYDLFIATQDKSYEGLGKQITLIEKQIRDNLTLGYSTDGLVQKYTELKKQQKAVNDEFDKLTGSPKVKSAYQKLQEELKKTRDLYKSMVLESDNYSKSQIEDTRKRLGVLEAENAYYNQLQKHESVMQITNKAAKELGDTLVDSIFKPLGEGETLWSRFKDAGIDALKAIAQQWSKQFLQDMVTGFSAGFRQVGASGGGFMDMLKGGFMGAGSLLQGKQLPSLSSNNEGGTTLSIFSQDATALSQTLLSQTQPAISSTMESLGGLSQNALNSATSLTGVMNPALQTAQSVATMATAAPIAATGIGALGTVMTTASSTFTTAVPSLIQMASAMQTLATSASQAAVSMAALAVSTAAESVAKIPFVGGFLAPVAALATGAAIAGGALLTGAGIGAGALVAGGGQMLGGAMSKLGTGGKIIPHAKGGIVSSPTMFPMQGGNVGLAGEAGTEVIAPAKRMSNGELGIGAVQPQVTVNNYTNAAVEVIKRPNNEMEIKISELNAMLSSSRSNKGMSSAQQRMQTKGRQIG